MAGLKNGVDMAKEIRMTDIAAELGVSTVTVSKALSGKQGVSKRLRDRILEKAAELGYELDQKKAAADFLHAGLLVANRSFMDPQSCYWNIYQQLAQAASQEQVGLLLEVVSPDAQAQAHLPMLLSAAKPDGLILLGDFGKKYRRMLSESSGLPMVWLDSYGDSDAAACILPNNIYGASEATGCLLDKGYRQIGFVGSILVSERIRSRYLGYVNALVKKNLPVRPEWVLEDHDADGRPLEPEEFALPEELPDAFFVYDSLIAHRFATRLRMEGFRVPEDIGISCYNDGWNPDGFPCYVPDIQKMAAGAMIMLRGRIRDGKARVGKLVIPGELVQ